MKTKQEYTPGPWHVTHGLNEGFIASDGHGFVPIRTPFREDAFKPGPSRSDHSDSMLDANAHLIAAAPELLGALREFMNVWGSRDAHSLSKRSQKRRSDMWDAANAAVAKAEGVS